MPMTRYEIQDALQAVVENNDTEASIKAAVEEVLSGEPFLGPMVICESYFRSVIIQHETRGSIEAQFTPPYMYEGPDDDGDGFTPDDGVDNNCDSDADWYLDDDADSYYEDDGDCDCSDDDVVLEESSESAAPFYAALAQSHNDEASQILRDHGASKGHRPLPRR